MGLSGRAIKATAWAAVVAGVAAPVLRKRIKAPALVTQAVAFGAPVGAAVAMRGSRKKEVVVACLQMWAYVAAYKTPHDDEEAQKRRLMIDYPIRVDKVIGMGQLPTVRLQRALAKADEWGRLDRLLVWTHWVWFMVPHTALAWIMVRRHERFVRSATMMYAVFDIGATIYWLAPTAPPWYAASAAGREEFDDQQLASQGVEAVQGADAIQGAQPGWRSEAESESGESDQIVVRRMMAEYGEHFWKEGWGPLYSVLGGNPFAAMPSLHFATSLMAALLLRESGRVEGTVGWAYVGTLGFALVYLGEHYVIDLVAGAALTLSVRWLGPFLAPQLRRVTAVLAALEARAHAGGA